MQITVKGEASRRCQPEQATLTLSFEFEGAEKADVVAHCTRLVKRFTAETESLREGADAPITSWVLLPIGVRSWRPWTEDGEPKPLRHAAHATARLRFGDFVALSTLIDQWGGEDGVRVGSVEWSLTDESLKTEEAAVLAEAVAAAQDRAQVMATAAGQGSVSFTEIADMGLLDGARPEAQFASVARGMSLARDESGIDLVPEEIAINVTIHARFQTS